MLGTGTQVRSGLSPMALPIWFPVGEGHVQEEGKDKQAITKQGQGKGLLSMWADNHTHKLQSSSSHQWIFSANMITRYPILQTRKWSYKG